MKIVQEKPTELKEVQDAGKGATVAIVLTLFGLIALSSWLVFKFVQWIVNLF